MNQDTPQRRTEDSGQTSELHIPDNEHDQNPSPLGAEQEPEPPITMKIQPLADITTLELAQIIMMCAPIVQIPKVLLDSMDSRVKRHLRELS